MRIGILHPGAMGAAMGAALRSGGHAALWAAAGRSDATAHRAELADLVAVPTVADLARRADVLISLCPPHAAVDVAREVAAAGPGGLYVDTNAVAPSTVAAIGDLLGAGRVVDAAVIGPPPWRPDTTRLCLSGPHTAEVAALFDDTPVRVVVVGDQLGQASAVKACYAMQSKALPAMWALVAAAAQHYDVAGPVRDVLAASDVDLSAHLEGLARRATAKAWRWDGEMAEAVRMLADAGLPTGLSDAAAEVYRRVAAVLPRDAPADPQAWTDAVRGYRTVG